MTRIQADALLLVCAIVWGVAFVFQKAAMAHMGPMAFIMARAAIAALVLVPIALWELRRAGPVVASAPQRAFPAGLSWQGPLAGLLFFLGGALQQLGIVTTSVTNAGFFTSLYVVIVPLVAWALRGDAPSGLVWGAVSASLAGSWALGGGGISALSAGDALVIVSALFWALHVVSLGLPAARARPITFTAVQFAVVAVLGLLAALGTGELAQADWRAAAIDIAYVGVLSSALTFTLLTVAMRHAAPAEAAVIVSSETVFAALAGYIWLGERLDALGWIGAALMVAATLAVALGGRPAAHRPEAGIEPAS